MSKTIVLPHFHKSHSMPKCLVDVVKQIRELKGVIRIGIGEFGDKSKYAHQFKWKVQTMNRTNHTVKICIGYQEFEQDIYVTVRPERVSELASFLNNYQPQHRENPKHL